jgi:hypothetical protein
MFATSLTVVNILGLKLNRWWDACGCDDDDDDDDNNDDNNDNDDDDESLFDVNKCVRLEFLEWNFSQPAHIIISCSSS